MELARATEGETNVLGQHDAKGLYMRMNPGTSPYDTSGGTTAEYNDWYNNTYLGGDQARLGGLRRAYRRGGRKNLIKMCK